MRLMKAADAGKVALSELPAFPGIETDEPAWDPVEHPVGTLAVDGHLCRVELLNQLKRGKEAAVYCCRATSAAGSSLIAVKRFIPILHRAFRRDTDYRVAKFSRTERRGRTRSEDTEEGQEVRLAEWVDREFSTLQLLHAAGADVPRPLGRSGSHLLMEYLGDEDRVAPLLHHVRPPEPEARVVFDRLLRNVRLFLSRHRVHGDLSAFNVLYHQGRPVVIDFPQAVDPRENPAAEMLLQRDVENLCRWYARSGGAADALGLSTNLWSTYLAGRLGEGGVG